MRIVNGVRMCFGVRTCFSVKNISYRSAKIKVHKGPRRIQAAPYLAPLLYTKRERESQPNNLTPKSRLTKDSLSTTQSELASNVALRRRQEAFVRARHFATSFEVFLKHACPHPFPLPSKDIISFKTSLRQTENIPDT